ncbi:FHA domain-containing protein [Pyxidicoccus trucidator]|uniref:FHA domain-containing protein n=1 Tax=Pyxidicoccus trucidator TaxID=2709662 RepID=UPI0013DB62C2|nr:FHA domain-containing protein [Pyxidicoccus trucidator]
MRVPDLTAETRDWLRSPENFQTVRVDAETGTLAWGDARPFSASLVYWRVEKYRVKATVRRKDGTVLSSVLLGGRGEVWSKGLTLGRDRTNTVVVDQEGVAPVHARVTVGGGHHPCYFIEVVEGLTSAGGTSASTPGERLRVPARQPLLLEVGPCVVEIE